MTVNRTVLLDVKFFNMVFQYGVFLYKLLNNLCDSVYCTQYLSLAVPPRRTRTSLMFYVPVANSNFHVNSPLYRMQLSYNNYFTHIDLFASSLNVVRAQLMSAVASL